MHRTQLLLEPWQYERLRALADLEGRSISAIVREILALHLEAGADRARRRLADLRGIADGPEDLAQDHDRYLYGTDAED